MRRWIVTAAYAKSLGWVAVCAALAICVAGMVDLVLVDIIRNNPHRTASDTLQMMIFLLPIAAIIAAIGTTLVFALPQLFQTAIACALPKEFTKLSYAFVIAALPLTTIITWYSYEYLSPTNMNLGINAGPEWKPFQHGLTMSRYLKTFAVQAAVTLFSVAYVEARSRRKSSLPIQLIALVAAVIAGCAWGQIKGGNQHRPTMIDAR